MNKRPSYLEFPNLIVLVGRTNVGKSALFNRIIGDHKALVAQEKNLTRDLNIQPTVWERTALTFVDTGGADLERKDEIDEAVWKKIGEVLENSTIIIFVTDVRQGLSPFEREWIKDLKKHRKPLIIAANKSDSGNLRSLAAEFYQLGVESVLPTSALTGSGIGDLLDAVVKTIKPKPPEQESDKPIMRLSIVGKTNVGKSSLVNSLLGESRMIVSEIPHTTREPIDSHINWDEKTITLIDTAGLRRRAKMATKTENIGATRTWRAMGRSDVVLFMFDASSDITAQDRRIAGMIHESRKPMIVVANKWDLIPDKTSKTMDKFKLFFGQQFPFLSWAPMIFISAKTGLHAKDIFQKSLEVFSESKKIIQEEDLTRYLRRKMPPSGKIRIRFYGAKQTSNTPPSFEINIQTKKKLPGSFYAYMENRIREQFGFEGAPIIINAKPDSK